MRVVVVGHVDHGKSTLIGRLFYDAGVLPGGRHAQLVSAASRRNVDFEFANFTDGLQAERDQNITIDTTQVLFRWCDREVLFIDAPGHCEFLKNMISGAAQADIATMVVDAFEGIGNQTRRHALLLTLLGVTRVVIVVNKIDKIGNPSVRFGHLATNLHELFSELGLTVLAVVPTAASLGWNVVTREPSMAWYMGPTFIDVLLDQGDSVNVAPLPAVFAVQDVYRRNGQRFLVGRVECGRIETGDHLLILPTKGAVTVDHCSRAWGSDTVLTTGDVGEISIREASFASRGDVLAAPDAPLVVAAKVRTRVFWLGRTPLSPEHRYELRLGTQRSEASVTAISRVIDSATLIERSDRSNVPPYDVAEVEFSLSRTMVIPTGGSPPMLARFVIVGRAAQPDILGGGLVLGGEVARAEPAASPLSRVQITDRRLRFGHRPAVVWLTGLSGAGKSTLAEGLESVLFERDMHVVVLDGDHLRETLSSDLGFTEADRAENTRRVATVARLFAESGAIVAVALVSPLEGSRRHARAIVATSPSDVLFAEVFVDAALSVCESRDPKNLYRRARAGEIGQFTGITASYERPSNADLVIKTDECTPTEAIGQLVDFVLGLVKTP